jgi:hypothetical protein
MGGIAKDCPFPKASLAWALTSPSAFFWVQQGAPLTLTHALAVVGVSTLASVSVRHPLSLDRVRPGRRDSLRYSFASLFAVVRIAPKLPPTGSYIGKPLLRELPIARLALGFNGPSRSVLEPIVGEPQFLQLLPVGSSHMRMQGALSGCKRFAHVDVDTHRALTIAAPDRK